MNRTEWQQRLRQLMQEITATAEKLHALMLDYPREGDNPPNAKHMRQNMRQVLREYKSLALIRLAELLRMLPSPSKGSKRANELDGKTWLSHSISVWSDLTKTKEERELKHPAMFPCTLAERLIRCFTNEQSRVILDPFVGVGSTLIAAKELGKDAIGIEISPEFAEIAQSRVSQVMPFEGESDVRIHVADSRTLCDHVPDNSVDMVITSPPYLGHPFGKTDSRL